MELLYLYIKEYDGLFENEQFNFSSKYIAELRNNELSINENHNSIKDYYGNNVSNVVMFLGKNGMGKSTLLDILGMDYHDRCKDLKYRKTEKKLSVQSYFILYHLMGDYYSFEFVDDAFITGKNKIANMDLQGECVEKILYKCPMGTIFRLDDGIFKYCDNVLLQCLGESRLEYAYITSDKYNHRISKKYRDENNEMLFDRRYYLDGEYYEYMYNFLIHSNEINNELLQNKSITIINKIHVDFYAPDRDEAVKDYLDDIRRKLDSLLESEGSWNVRKRRKDGANGKKNLCNNKEEFLDRFFSEAIEFYFLEQFVGWSESEGKIINIKNNEVSVSKCEERMKTLDDNLKGQFLNGKAELMDFQMEYAFLQYMIQNSRTLDGKIDLKAVLKYTLNRVEIAAKNISDVRDRQAVIEMLELLDQFPEEYFASNKSIRIPCEFETQNEAVVNFLHKYDFYLETRNNEGNNSISEILEVKLPKMSEGQRVFLDIVAKAITAIYKINPKDSLVLMVDEPDRALHPELARKFIAVLLEKVKACKDRNVQIVLSSHSPFIVTDILPEGVYSIKEVSGKRIISNKKDTYATNIYSLLMDSFMLENTFGQYSYQKLQDIIKLLKEQKNVSEEELERSKMIIDRVGEKTIKNKMMQLYYEKKNNQKNDLINLLHKENDADKLLKIREILEGND